MHYYSSRITRFIILTLLLSATCHAVIELPPSISDNMVFQRQKPMTVWGKAKPDENISVRFHEFNVQTNADQNGEWQVNLPAMEAGGPYDLSITEINDSKQITGVYVGDVWVFSGQSNMQVSFDYYLNLDNISDVYKKQFSDTLAHCPEDRLVRNYMVATKDQHGQTIRNIAENNWFFGDPETVKHCNPIAYYFAKEVSQKTGIVTAAVRIAWGGQYIERFYRGADIYEYMLKPWSKLPVKGIIWYQGENNLYKDGDRLAYALKLQLLIRDYRRLWNDSELPFFIVQLPPSTYSSRSYNDEHSLPVFLEAQRQALAIPFTAMVNTSDLGMSNGLHQPQKYDIAVRLANLAFANVYGFADAVPAGPQYKKHVCEKNKIRVYFDTFGSCLTTNDGQSPKYFEVLPHGKNQSFVKAQAKIDGNSVLVWNNDVKDPVDIRFAFREQDLMEINLTNSEGIPAATFWAGATKQLHPAVFQEE